MSRFVVLKGNQYAGPLFEGWEKRLSCAGTFSRAEADAFVAGRKGDGYSVQPLAFYADFLREERARVEALMTELEPGGPR